ncbi:MAG: hypothetical protein CMK09_19090 [Ponticaulis sp.]|nr:hypothetical protein [Ponticaulis sp.]|tara:strand:- start:188996 stop:189781 length:786 start_codon:yes stop_codon:yes gene_type:complete
MDLPKQMFCYWDRDLATAPSLVRKNIEKWQSLNPDYNLIVFNEESAADVFEANEFDARDVSAQIKSDFLRLALLKRNGGIWIDATLLPTVPLDDWLPSVWEKSGFFAFSAPYPDRLLSSWFLASVAENKLIDHWFDLFSKYWQINRRLLPEKSLLARKLGRKFHLSFISPPWSYIPFYPYYCVHYLFERCVRENEVCAEIWEATPKVSAFRPLLFSKARKELADFEGELEEVASALYQSAPLHKLNWRYEWPESLWRLDET